MSLSLSLSQSLFLITAFLMSIMIAALAGRLILGPTTADRLAALNVINTLTPGVMLLLAAVYDSFAMIGAAIVYMALSFVGILYFARYMEGGM